jgi:hypothetical protein
MGCLCEAVSEGVRGCVQPPLRRGAAKSSKGISQFELHCGAAGSTDQNSSSAEIRKGV